MANPTEIRHVQRLTPIVWLGTPVWFLLAIAYWLMWFQLDLIELLFLMAPWIVVPVGVSLILPVSLESSPLLTPWRVWLIYLSAALCTAALLFPAGHIAAGFAGSWLILCALFAWDGLRRIWATRLRSLPQFCFAVAEGYLIVGGAGLIVSRLGWQTLGFAEPIILLTAVHFHFAGFLSSIFAGLTYQTLIHTKWANPVRPFLLAAVLGPGLLGISFVIDPALKVISAIGVVLGVIGLAIGMARAGMAVSPRSARFLLQAASGCVIASMVLAALWALGEYSLHQIVDLSQMARIHGFLNSVGFAFLGLVGWSKAAHA